MHNGSAAAVPVEVDDHMWRELVDNSLECELCNEPYDDVDSEDGHIPRLLTCGHTYCQSCLDGWANHAGPQSEEIAIIECPTCRRTTHFKGSAGARALPKNFELVRARQEMETQTQTQLRRFKEIWMTQLKEKEQLAKEAEEHARTAQRESVQASQRAKFLTKQVEINEQEKKRAQQLAEEARHRALVASQQAEALQAETENLKLQLQNDAAQLARVQHDASSAAQVVKELHSKAEQLQQQVDCVRAQLSLHAGRHDPSKLVVLVADPTTVGSWLMPYTRYAVISIASDTTKGAQAIDPYQAAKTWTRLRQVEEPSSSVKVYRRYSDFVWLQRELQRQFPFELVPCVPGKQIFFNKEKEFVGERMRFLQAFLRGVLRQPHLAVTEEVRAFLLSTTEELESLRRATSSYYSSVDGDDLLSVDYDTPNDDVESRSSSPPVSSPPSASKDSTLSKRSSSWSAWGAVSAITSSAAKLVTTTGTALSGIGTKTGTAGLPEDPELELSKSFVEAEGADAATQASIERRRRYIDVARSYQSVAQKGSQLSRASRQQSHHLHRMCELLHDMNKLDQGHAMRRRQRLAASQDVRIRADEEDDDMETRAFGERAPEVFSSISLNTKNDADCMEYALLEVVRMQTLELGGIEDAFARVRSREEALQTQQEANANSSMSEGLSAVNLKREELATHRRELNEKVAVLDPGRSQFVLDVLRKNTSEMHKLARTKRKLFQVSQQQLFGAQR
ncbi:hypothetical protein DVH05_007117 [Phytophthora capsici]|nr:hypothetical protein DVH05_007117 [Phytophthora capsici]